MRLKCRSSIIPSERISHILSLCEKFKYNELSIDSADIHTMNIKRRKRSWTDMHINVLFE